MLQCLCLLVLFAVAYASTTAPKKPDINDNRGNTPFFLQDPNDQMCLGPYGFTFCDESALWILTKRSGSKLYSLVSFTNPTSQGVCLQRKSGFLGLTSGDKVIVGPCNKGSAKNWNFEFVDNTHVKLSNYGQCLVRGKKGFKNSLSVEPCEKDKFNYIALLYHSTAVHENGFLLKGADGSCFNGTVFRPCTGVGSSLLLWGQGLSYQSGKHATRYFFGMQGDHSMCLIQSSGNKVEKGLCSDSRSKGWDLYNGQLSRGSKCLARLPNDRGVLVDCKEGKEFVTMEIPTIDTSGGATAGTKAKFSGEEKTSSYLNDKRKSSKL